MPADEFSTRVDAEHADATLEHLGRAPLQSMDRARTALRYLPKQGATDTVPESIDAWVANRNWSSPASTERTSTHRQSGPSLGAGCLGPMGEARLSAPRPMERKWPKCSTLGVGRCSVPANLAGGACWWFTLLMCSEDRSRDDPADAREAHFESHEADLERREAAVAERETAVAKREAALAERMNVAETTLAAADERDAVSDTRDAAAEKRGNDADLAEMLDPKSEYGAHWPERRAAAGDRRHAKDDRTASRDDRLTMTEGDEEHDTDMT